MTVIQPELFTIEECEAEQQPRLLDLFASAGGTTVGYARAGFAVTGNDLKRKRSWPSEFPFIAEDALELLDRINLAEAFGLAEQVGLRFEVIAASPPCQFYSITKHSHHVEHPDLLGPVREKLQYWAQQTGGVYIIENVAGAPLENPLVLCGTHFGLETTDTDGTPLILKRHRLFESNITLTQPEGHEACTPFGRKCVQAYKDKGYSVGGVYGGGSDDRTYAKTIRKGGYTPAKQVRERLMGIDWMGQTDLSLAIPPAYTEHLGKQVMHFLAERKALLTGRG